jgi:hypothetical protein
MFHCLSRPITSLILGLSSRAMSTPAPCHGTVYKFLVYAPDKTEEGTLARRMAVRDQHISNAKAAAQLGFLSESLQHTKFVGL